MAKAKAARTKAEPKELKLVCKCGDCRHWEIILVKGTGTEEFRQTEYIQCMSCGVKVKCYFSIGPHEGLHYERHNPSEK
jgi:hypothetical protein